MSRSSLLAVHRVHLERFRHAMNLVGPGSIDVHYDDAEAALEGLMPRGRWVDLGTGAGFPGVVLAAQHPELVVDLVDSRRKRCVFLEGVLAEARVDDGVRVLCQRVEELPEAAYDGVTGRAFAPPEVLLAHADRLLRPGGEVLLFLQADADMPARHGFREVSNRPYAVDGKQRRAVVLARD